MWGDSSRLPVGRKMAERRGLRAGLLLASIAQTRAVLSANRTWAMGENGGEMMQTHPSKRQQAERSVPWQFPWLATATLCLLAFFGGGMNGANCAEVPPAPDGGFISDAARGGPRILPQDHVLGDTIEPAQERFGTLPVESRDRRQSLHVSFLENIFNLDLLAQVTAHTGSDETLQLVAASRYGGVKRGAVTLLGFRDQRFKIVTLYHCLSHPTGVRARQAKMTRKIPKDYGIP